MWLFFRGLLWTILCPGTVTLLGPWLILSGSGREVIWQNWQVWPGLFLILSGAGILFWCIFAFAMQGKGTLSPVDPAKRLVVKGLYRYTRNPMYVGVVGILLGEALLFQSYTVLGYTAVVFFVFNVFIRLHEEPYLQREFGQEYERYRETVGRWLPRRFF